MRKGITMAALTALHVLGSRPSSSKHVAAGCVPHGAYDWHGGLATCLSWGWAARGKRHQRNDDPSRRALTARCSPALVSLASPGRRILASPMRLEQQTGASRPAFPSLLACGPATVTPFRTVTSSRGHGPAALPTTGARRDSWWFDDGLAVAVALVGYARPRIPSDPPPSDPIACLAHPPP